MDGYTFKNLAASFENAAKYSYEFIAGKNGKKVIIISSLDTSEFTHIIGLDHIPHIKAMAGNKSYLKKILFEQMLRGDFTYSDIPDPDIAELNKPIANTNNSSTGQPYSIQDRITGLLNIDSILNNAYKGKIYKWNKKQCRVMLKNGKSRYMSISADYVLKIPGGKNIDENYYFFMVQSNKPKDKKNIKNEPIRVSVISAFLDCLDLTRGQERPMVILQEAKINIRTKQNKVIYTHQSYRGKR